MIALEKARSCLETLGLLQASEILDSRLQKAAAESATYTDFLSDILGEEIVIVNENVDHLANLIVDHLFFE